MLINSLKSRNDLKFCEMSLRYPMELPVSEIYTIANIQLMFKENVGQLDINNRIICGFLCAYTYLSTFMFSNHICREIKCSFYFTRRVQNQNVNKYNTLILVGWLVGIFATPKEASKKLFTYGDHVIQTQRRMEHMEWDFTRADWIKKICVKRKIRWFFFHKECVNFFFSI